MNSKMLLAFAGGLIVASGVTYVAMRRTPVAAEASLQATAPAAVSAAPASSRPSAVAAEPVNPPPRSEPDFEPPSRAKGVEPPSRPKKERASSSPRNPPMRVDVQRASTQFPEPAPTSPASPPQQSAPVPAPISQAPPQSASNPEPAPAYQPPQLPPPAPHTVTIPGGTLLTVRLGETLSSERNQPGDQFTSVLDQPLVVDGFVIAERGSRAQGRIVELERSGKVRGIAKLAIELTQIKTADGQNLRINTSAFSKQAETTRNKDAAKVGAGAVIGAAIGAIAGGGKGAAIGAGVGGAAGAGDVAMTRGQAADLRVETRVSFRLSEPVTVTERLQ